LENLAAEREAQKTRKTTRRVLTPQKLTKRMIVATPPIYSLCYGCLLDSLRQITISLPALSASDTASRGFDCFVLFHTVKGKGQRETINHFTIASVHKLLPQVIGG
jgi:hypothetical protein